MTRPSGAPSASVSAVPAVDLWRRHRITSLTVVTFVSEGLQRLLPSRQGVSG